MDNTVIISTPPHVKSRRTTKMIMLDVIIALLPCTAMGLAYYRLDAFITIITSVLAAVICEFIYYFIAKGGFARKCKDAKQVCKDFLHQFDFTSIVTGLILALIVPSSVHFYEVMLGSAFSIIIVKMLFGGTGKNLVNPAATGRVFMLLCFSATMGGIVTNAIGAVGAVGGDGVINTSATVLTELLGDGTTNASFLDIFLGTGITGSIGETCKLAIIVGGLYLIIRKVIKWWQPVLYIGVSFLMTLLLYGCDGTKNFAMMALDQTFSGGLFFGAVFMATDYVTSPKSRSGQIIYYVILGLLTALLRYFTGVEVVSFVIMIGNIITHLLDRYCIPHPFGYVKVKKQKAPKADKAAAKDAGAKEGTK
ncbi:MAG: RnfABCDGE type electron transport complex subunit D [Clostridia bacterium]|nr:RnfABCDGE type electron transport complex subunit D [Clostridia bacterium]